MKSRSIQVQAAPSPRISVFITSYNQKAYLREAIDSVLAQTLLPYEVIVVDDSSTDGSQDLIQDYAARYPNLIKTIFHQTNTGVTQSRIDALEAVNGDYVTYVDGDDRFLPTKLEKEYAALRQAPEARIAFSNNYYMTSEGIRTGMWIEDDKPPQGKVFVQTFGRLYPQRSLYRMELVEYAAWKKIGFHDRNLSIYEDFDMRIRMTKQLQTVYCDETLSEIRCHGRGLSNSRGSIHQKSLDYIFQKNRGLLSDLKPLDRKFAQKGYSVWQEKAIAEASPNMFDYKDSPRIPNNTNHDEKHLSSVAANHTYRGHNLIFLVSQPRSGSTLLQRLIAGHPEVHTTAEPWIMLHPLYALKKRGIKTDYRASLARKGLHDFLSQFADGESIYIQSLRLQAAYLYGHALNQSQKRLFLDKTPRYYHVLPELHRVFPDAKFILLFRNPLAVFSSTLKTWLNNDVRKIDPATRMDLYEAPLHLINGLRILKEDALVVHYEHLVEHPEKELKRICERLELGYSDTLLEYGLRPAPSGRFGDPKSIYRHQRPVKDYINNWVENLQNHDLAPAAEHLLTHLGDDVLSPMGYPLKDLQDKIRRLKISKPSLPVAIKKQKKLIHIAKQHMDAGHWDDALDTLLNIIRSHPDNAAAYDKLGMVYNRLNNSTKAVECFRQAIALNPENTSFQKNLAQFYCLNSQQIEQAAEIYLNLLADNPLDTEALLGMAEVSLAGNQPKDALDFCSSVQEIDPDNQEVVALTDKINRVSNSQADAESELRLFSRIRENTRQGQLEEAVRDLEMHIGHDPDSAIAFNDLGVLYSQLGQMDKVPECYRRAITLEPHNTTFKKNLADFLYLIRGQVEEAEAIYNGLAQVHPEDVEVWLAKGRIKADQNRDAEAAAFFEKVLTLEPDNAIAREYASRFVNHFRSVGEIDGCQQRGSQNKNLGHLRCTDTSIRVSAVVSTYDSERFMAARLRNLIEQSLFHKGQLEIIVVDADSTQNEGDIVASFSQRHPRIKYIRTSTRESVYSAWNRGIKSSRGVYFVNANTDDRFAPHALEKMADALDANPDYDAAFGDWLITRQENDTFESGTPKSRLVYPPYHPPLLFYLHIGTHANFIRSRIFDSIGLFDGSFKVFGDREFMFRFACAGLKAYRVESIVGLYLENPNSLARRTRDAQEKEWWPLVECYSQMPNFLQLIGYDTPPEDRTIAAHYTDTGCLGQNLWKIDGELISSIGPSPHLFAKAIAHDPNNTAALNNLAVLRCHHSEATRFFKKALGNADGFQKKIIADNLKLHRAGVTDPSRYHFLKSNNQHYQVIQEKNDTPAHALDNLLTTPQESAETPSGEEHLLGAKVTFENEEAKSLTDKLKRYLDRLKQKPDDVKTLLALGSLCTQLNRLKDALNFFLDALASDPNCLQAAENTRALLIKLDHAGEPRATARPADRPPKANKPIVVSAIVSVYNAERFLQGCLQNLEQQTLADHLEIIVVDSGSQQNEAAIVRKFQSRYNNIRYLRTDERESVYAAWNRGIKIARGKYITNANADDRHRRDALETMARALDQHPETALVYADCIITETENESFTSCTPVGSYRWRDWNRRDLLGGACFIGPQPMWRRRLHAEHGYFNENYVTSGDYEFWCRIAQCYEFWHIDDVLGLYLRSPHSIEHRNAELKQLENQEIQKRYRQGNQGDALDENSIPISHQTHDFGPEDIAHHICEARRRYEQERYTEAWEILQRVLVSFPETWAAWRILVDIMLQSGETGEAIDFLKTLEKRTKLPADIYACIGGVYEAAGDLSEAERYANLALTLDPHSPWTLNLSGVLSFHTGDPQAAIQKFQMALAQDANWGEPWTNIGTVAWHEGRVDQALDCFEKGFALSPTAPQVAALYHSAIAATGHYDRSRPFWEKAVQNHPDFRKGWYFLIDVLIQLEDIASAMSVIELMIIKFGADSQLLAAAQQVRNKIGPLQISGSKSTLSLCMIVKNEEKHIANCLSRMKSGVDEMIVVDTGSSDTTRDLAAVFGAKVFDFPWSDDFAAARNYSLSKASGQWIIVVDADEVIAPQDCQQLRQILRQHRSMNTAFSITTRNYTTLCNRIDWTANDGTYPEEEVGTGWTPSEKVRLFPNRPGLRFDYPVHEVIRPSIEREGIKIRKCSIPVHHYGHLNQTAAARKGASYYQIGIHKLDQLGNDPQAIQELAIQAGNLERHEEAVDLWHKLLAIEPHNARACVNLSTAYDQLGRYADARSAALRAVDLKNDLKEAHFNVARADLHLGRAAEAAVRLKPLVVKNRNYFAAQFMLGCARICADQMQEGFDIISRIKSTSVWPAIAHSFDEIAQSLLDAGQGEYNAKIYQAASHLELAIETAIEDQAPAPAFPSASTG